MRSFPRREARAFSRRIDSGRRSSRRAARSLACNAKFFSLFFAAAHQIFGSFSGIVRHCDRACGDHDRQRSDLGIGQCRLVEHGLDFGPGDLVDRSFITAQTLEFSGAPRGDQESQTNGLEDQELGECGLELGCSLVHLGELFAARTLDQRSLEVCRVHLPLGHSRDPGLKLLWNLHQQGVAELRVKGVEVGEGRIVHRL